MGAWLSKKKINRHYLPEWLLRNFRDKFLYQLDIFSSLPPKVKHPRKAGSGRGLWPQDIEDTLTKYDGAAAQICHDKLYDKTSITLTEMERKTFALWLAHFFARSPKRMLGIADFFKNKNLRQELIDGVYADREKTLDYMRENDTGKYEQMRLKFGDEADERMLAHYADYIAKAPENLFATPETMRHYFMRRADVMNYAKCFLGYEWTWLSRQDAFVLGDDPLVRFHLPSKTWDAGVRQQDVEITMPLMSSLCLCLVQYRVKKKNQIQPISKSEARSLNCRQRGSATKYVYAHDPALLNFVQNPWSV